MKMKFLVCLLATTHVTLCYAASAEASAEGAAGAQLRTNSFFLECTATVARIEPACLKNKTATVFRKMVGAEAAGRTTYDNVKCKFELYDESDWFKDVGRLIRLRKETKIYPKGTLGTIGRHYPADGAIAIFTQAGQFSVTKDNIQKLIEPLPLTPDSINTSLEIMGSRLPKPVLDEIRSTLEIAETTFVGTVTFSNCPELEGHVVDLKESELSVVTRNAKEKIMGVTKRIGQKITIACTEPNFPSYSLKNFVWEESTFAYRNQHHTQPRADEEKVDLELQLTPARAHVNQAFDEWCAGKLLASEFKKFALDWRIRHDAAGHPEKNRKGAFQKRALLICCSSDEFNDYELMSHFLQEHRLMGYDYDDIEILTDENVKGTDRQFDFMYVKERLIALGEGMADRPGSMLLHITSHGDTDAPLWGQKESGVVVNDSRRKVPGWMRPTLFTDLGVVLNKVGNNSKVNVIVISDSCHSENIMKLPYEYDTAKAMPWKDSTTLYDNKYLANQDQQPLVLCLSACKKGEETTGAGFGSLSYGNLTRMLTSARKIKMEQRWCYDEANADIDSELTTPWDTSELNLMEKPLSQLMDVLPKKIRKYDDAKIQSENGPETPILTSNKKVLALANTNLHTLLTTPTQTSGSLLFLESAAKTAQINQRLTAAVRPAVVDAADL